MAFVGPGCARKMVVPVNPKIYHIVHIDRLASIIANGGLWCDARIVRGEAAGTTIGMNSIKRRRLCELTLESHPDLYVGYCVPFYFCPRSVMLYVIHCGNHAELVYRGGQGPIVHLQSDMRQAVAWAQANHRRWAFTLSNAGSYYFEDRCDLGNLGEINWDAVQTNQWQANREGKQAEFLMEDTFPWDLIERIGVASQQVYQQVVNALPAGGHRPAVEVKCDWYY
jgi:hypothetical protein